MSFSEDASSDLPPDEDELAVMGPNMEGIDVDMVEEVVEGEDVVEDEVKEVDSFDGMSFFVFILTCHFSVFLRVPHLVVWVLLASSFMIYGC